MWRNFELGPSMGGWLEVKEEEEREGGSGEQRKKNSEKEDERGTSVE